MSKENLEHCMKQRADSKELQAKIGAEITGDALVALGAAHSCEFSIADVQVSAEPSDAQMEGISVGFMRASDSRTKRYKNTNALMAEDLEEC